MSPFPSSYYVYEHRHPETGGLVYIGHGSRERAWTSGRTGLPLRSPNHQKWIDTLLGTGYLPSDWVHVPYRSLTKEEARTLERDLIRRCKPEFNLDIRSKCLKFTPSIYKEALKLRKGGLSYKAIGEKVGLSTMVIHRGLNKMPISLEVALEQERS